MNWLPGCIALPWPECPRPRPMTLRSVVAPCALVSMVACAACIVVAGITAPHSDWVRLASSSAVSGSVLAVSLWLLALNGGQRQQAASWLRGHFLSAAGQEV